MSGWPASHACGESMAGWFPVPEEDLPVLLPALIDWKPEGTGKGPLAKLPDFVKTKCPHCGGEADRETDVCDTFLDSSWYFLRYPSVIKKDGPFRVRPSSTPWDPVITRRWLPVNIYIGGAEHTVLHLLYSRFVTMAFHDWGLLDFDEPYKRFYAHGLIIAEGAKMSKSKGNIIIPDEYIAKYGADTLRTYLMFLGPFDMGGDFRDTGIAGMHRFLGRVWRLVSESFSPKLPKEKNQLDQIMHRTIKEVTEDLENLRYNTAIAHIMEFVNELQSSKLPASPAGGKAQSSKRNGDIIKNLLLVLAPFAPHMTEELYQRLSAGISNFKFQISNYSSIHLHSWPSFDPKYLIEDEVTIIVQVNGKVRETIQVQSSKSKVQKEIEELVGKSEKVKKYIERKTVRKVIFVPGRLINFVV
jgi:leucyl-tRNA synthetase